ncbi:MAG TPA: hypothetical protein VKR82_16925 [Candidatus Acidoferrales bacterium]|nr:hypothetical protein [Candidatus Acidoferrales bacterium]
MAVEGLYMVWRMRLSPIPYVRAYGDFVLRDALLAFSEMEKRADAVVNAEYERLSSQSVGEDWDGDMSVFAEAAECKGQAFYETMYSLRQMTLNLFTAGLFHLIEQQLANLCQDASFDVPPPRDTNIAIVTDWYERHFHISIRTLGCWAMIEELRLVANVVKHAEGGSARELRNRREELFVPPSIRNSSSEIQRPAFPVAAPLAGDDLYVTEEVFQRYAEAANELMEEIAHFFDVQGAEYFPKPG